MAAVTSCEHALFEYRSYQRLNVSCFCNKDLIPGFFLTGLITLEFNRWNFIFIYVSRFNKKDVFSFFFVAGDSYFWSTTDCGKEGQLHLKFK